MLKRERKGCDLDVGGSSGKVSSVGEVIRYEGGNKVGSGGGDGGGAERGEFLEKSLRPRRGPLGGAGGDWV